MSASPRNVTRRSSRRGVRAAAAFAVVALLAVSVAGFPARAAGESKSPSATPAAKASASRDSTARASRPAASARVAVPAGTASVAKPAARPPAQVPAKPAGTKPSPVVKTPSATPAPPSASTLAGKPAASKPAPPAAPKASAAATAKTASNSPAVVTVKTGKPAAVRRNPPAAVTSVEERVTYQYNALGRRDPFQALVGGGFMGADVASAPPDVGGLTLVGIVWGADDRFALVEDARGNSLVLRKGDRVMNGVVEGLRRDAMVVKLTVDGSTDVVEIPLTRKGDDSNENR